MHPHSERIYDRHFIGTHATGAGGMLDSSEPRLTIQYLLIGFNGRPGEISPQYVLE